MTKMLPTYAPVRARARLPHLDRGAWLVVMVPVAVVARHDPSYQSPFSVALLAAPNHQMPKRSLDRAATAVRSRANRHRPQRLGGRGPRGSPLSSARR